MSSKPTIALSRWADTISAILTTPASGLRDTGFVGGTIIDEGTVNYEINQLYQWALWLSDGDCAFHNLSATGTLGVTGATTLTGALTANGGIIVPTGQAVALNGSTTLTVGTGAVTFGGLVTASAGIAVPTGQAVTLNGSTTLAVGGNATVGGTLGVTGASTQAAITASGLITANAGVTAGANQHVTVSGTGAYKHGTDTLVIPAADGNSPNIAGGLWAYNSSGDNWLSGASGNALDFPIRLPTGRRILTVTFWYQRGSGTLSFDCFTSALSTGSRTSAITQITVSTGTAITSAVLTAGGGGHVVTASEQLFAMITSGSTSDRGYAVVVTYDYP